MLVQNLFDLDRVHVLAAAEEHVLLAVDDEKVPLVVVLCQIAGVEPAICVHCRRARLRVVEIAGAVRGTFQHEFADFVRTERMVVVVHHARVDKEIRATDRAGFANRVFWREREDAGTKLGHAESLFEANAFFLGVLFDQRHR